MTGAGDPAARDSSAPDLSVTLGPLSLRNPILTASGTFGYGEVCEPYMETSRLGGIVLKTITPEERIGNAPPRVAEVAGGMLNSIGLQNPGLDGFRKKVAPRLASFGTTVVVSIAGDTEEEFGRMAAGIADLRGIDAIELNVSCPNVEKGGMEFGTDPRSTARIVSIVRRECPFPVLAKLSPLVTDIGEIAKAAEDAGAHGLTVINTLPGLAVDWRRKRPFLGAGFGGLSGPALKPLALRQVHAVRQASRLPIVGVGGITTGADALEFIVTGASAVQVGTAIYVDPTAPVRILEEMTRELLAAGISRVASLVGALSFPRPRSASGGGPA
jgi:dihydroorotate dehydrogenase (NAD+) catalytic subunit